jgi:hypothetical protein
VGSGVALPPQLVVGEATTPVCPVPDRASPEGEVESGERVNAAAGTAGIPVRGNAQDRSALGASPPALSMQETGSIEDVERRSANRYRASIGGLCWLRWRSSGCC